MGYIFNHCLKFIVLIFLVNPVRTKEDCIAGEWEEWTSCVETGVDLLQEKGVGKLTRVRIRLSGEHCEKEDLSETKLCGFNDSSSPDPDSGDSGDETGGKGGETDKGKSGGDTDSTGDDDTGTAEHLSDDRTERTVFITLLSVSAVLLSTGGVVGAILIRQHRTLQRRHKILVMTKERIRLIDGKKLEVKSSGSMLCGMGPQVTVHNPAYESEEEEWVRASTFPTGQLKLQSN